MQEVVADLRLIAVGIDRAIHLGVVRIFFNRAIAKRVDRDNRPIIAIDALGNRAVKKYTDDSQVYSSVDPNGNQSQIGYDLLHRLRRTIGSDSDGAGPGQSLLHFY